MRPYTCIVKRQYLVHTFITIHSSTTYHNNICQFDLMMSTCQSDVKNEI